MKEYPIVMDEDRTLAMADAGASIARFGDGELRLAAGHDCISQVATRELTRELREILAAPQERLLVCLPRFEQLPPHKREGWAPYRTAPFYRLLGPGPYGSAFITRPDSAPHIDRPDYWEAVRGLWQDHDVILVSGTDRSLTPLDMIESLRLMRVKAPARDAYAEIDRIEAEVVGLMDGRTGVNAPRVIICLGAAGTVLAARLAQSGVHALDLGHIGMFMRHAGAYRVQASDLASPEYKAQLMKKHASMRWGKDGHSWASEVTAWAKALGADSILDYGCGRGTLAEALKPRRIWEYDPGIPGKDAPPKPVDMVVSTDVLEHIEPDRLDAVLQHMFDLAGKGAFMNIATRPARELLPDGRNAHLIVEPGEWWLGQLARIGWKIKRSENRKGFCVWLAK